MATTTPNYGWAVPTSTDLVKDGATAIETLGDAIDASMNTALGTKKAGMVLLNTTSFSAVSSQSINDVFSATYDSYKIILNISAASTSLNMRMRYRVGGADDSTSNYYSTWIAVNTVSDTTIYARSGANTTGNLSDVSGGSSASKIFTIEIHRPFLTANTILTGHQNDSGSLVTYNGGIGFNATTSFTGFTIIPSTGNVTGTVSVYGYNK
jgi:hypothetical protein